MSEAGYRLAANITVKIEILFFAACMAAFFYPFMTGRKEQGKSRIKKVLMVFGVYAAMYFVNMTTSIYGWLCMIIVLVLLVAASPFLDMDREAVLFWGAIFFCVKNLCVLVMRSISYFWEKNLEQKAGMMENAEEIFCNAALHFMITTVLQMILFSVLLYVAGCQLRKKAMKLHMRELCCLMLIPVTGILFVNIIFHILVIVNDGLVFQLYEQFPIFLGIVPVVDTLFYAGILITIASYQKMTGLQEEKEKYFVEQQQVHAIQERMEEVEQFYHGIRQMKHEMKNHLTNIKGLVRNGSYEDIEQYIDKMDEGMNVFEFIIKTGNTVTDVIVNDKQKAAEKQGIQFHAEFSYPESDGYDAYDIGVIINNLLQNALEACERVAEGKKYIDLSGRQKKKFYLISVKNPFEGEVTFDTKTNLPLSTKGGDRSLHGIGLLDAGVQARLNAARGKYAIVVPPALEEKLEDNPELSRSIIEKIATLIKEQDTVPGSMDSFTITLDHDGNISNYRLSGGGGEITISRGNGQKSKEEEAEEVEEQERNQRLAAKRALQRKEQLEKAELDKMYQQSLREAAWLYGQNL